MPKQVSAYFHYPRLSRFFALYVVILKCGCICRIVNYSLLSRSSSRDISTSTVAERQVCIVPVGQLPVYYYYYQSLSTDCSASLRQCLRFQELVQVERLIFYCCWSASLELPTSSSMWFWTSLVGVLLVTKDAPHLPRTAASSDLLLDHLISVLSYLLTKLAWLFAERCSVPSTWWWTVQTTDSILVVWLAEKRWQSIERWFCSMHGSQGSSRVTVH